MPKPAVFFVAFAMAVTAACVGVIARYGLGLGGAESALAALSALALMAFAHMAFVRPPGLDESRLEDLDRLATQLQSRVETLDVRISTLDAAVQERARAAARPLMEEIAALGGLVTSVAKEVAAHELTLNRVHLRLDAISEPVVAAPAPPPPVATEPPPVREPERAPEPPAPRAAPRRRAAARATPAAPKPQAPEAFDPLDAEHGAEEPDGPVDRGVAARVELALRDDRIDFYLQPVVALPNRRTLHYEGLSRLREPDGIALPEEFLAVAAAEGRLGEIDRRAIARGARVAARLIASGRTVGVFVNIAASTLGDEGAVSELIDIAERTPEVARALTLELTQEAFEGLDQAGRETRKALSERGWRFSIDQATDLRIEPRDLARRGVRFVKVPAAALLDPEAARGLAIHPSDLSSLLLRHGVDLIATHVEEEREVPELLDHEVRAAQGHLFGVPRPVREDPPAAPEPARAESQPRRFQPRPFVRRA
ncbi:EAL domain-containing protein [Methylopila henanensis]|uniref:EAL domain-containing protein n=1 Tax=Methylopila henanensis TaxID=873516 RepID=A0ABW4KCK0_9HYPH